MMVGKGENEQKLYNTSFWTWDGLLQCSYTGCFLYRVTEQYWGGDIGRNAAQRRPLHGQYSRDKRTVSYRYDLMWGFVDFMSTLCCEIHMCTMHATLLVNEYRKIPTGHADSLTWRQCSSILPTQTQSCRKASSGTYLLISSTERSPSSEAKRFLASPEIPRI